MDIDIDVDFVLRNGVCLDDVFVASFWMFMSLTCPFMTESEYLYQKRQVHLSLLNLTNDSKQTSVDGSGAGSCIGKTFVFDGVGPVPDRRHDDHFNSDHHSNSDHHLDPDQQPIPQSIHVCHAKASKLKQNSRDFRTKSGKRRTRRCDSDQSRVLFLSDHPRVTTKSDRERHAEAATQAVEARKPRVGIVQHNILFHNINGQFPSKCATNPIWLNFIKRRCIDHAIIAETKMNTTALKKLRGIPGYKMQAHPTQKIEKAALSNGMINLISTTSCRDTYGLRTDITNKYLFKTINNKLRLITVGVYVPPFSSRNIAAVHPRRVEVVDSIFRDLDVLVDAARTLNYRIVILGDFNSRDPPVTGDHDNNLMRHRFNAFIESNGLCIINLRRHRGVATCTKNGGGSIVDYVVTDDHPSWGRTHSISMDIPNVPFIGKSGVDSDHWPLIVELTVDTDALRRMAPRARSVGVSPYKIHYPQYRLQIKRDPAALRRAAVLFRNKALRSKHFQNLLQKLNHFKSARSVSKKARRRHVNELYELFNYYLNDALIQCQCFKRTRCRPQSQHNELWDDEMQSLIGEWEEVLREP